MMTAVRRTATVQPDGQLHLTVPELPPGTVADVIVLVPEVAPAATASATIADRLTALNRLRDSVKLTEEQAANWIEEIRLERLAWNRPPEPSPEP